MNDQSQPYEQPNHRQAVEPGRRPEVKQISDILGLSADARLQKTVFALACPHR
jgi:hypothetical protein